MLYILWETNQGKRKGGGKERAEGNKKTRGTGRRRKEGKKEDRK